LGDRRFLGKEMRWTRDKEALAGDTAKNRDGPDKNIFFDKRDSPCVQKQKNGWEWRRDLLYG
jgi:hypothetical protein